MGDEIMFFYQGYIYYLEAVRAKQVYKIAGRQGLSKLKLPEPVLVKVNTECFLQPYFYPYKLFIKLKSEPYYYYYYLIFYR